MEPKKLKDVGYDQYFHLKDSENSPIWFKNHYDKSSKTYSISPYEDVNRELFRKGTLIVYI